MSYVNSGFTPYLDRSDISSMKWTAELLRSGDSDLICAGTADMDFASAPPILDAIRAVADRGHLGYPYVDDRFYDAIGGWLARTTGWQIDARQCVSANVGIYTSFWAILDTFTEPGDEVIIQTPVHFVFNSIICSNGRKTLQNPLKINNSRYEMDFEQLEACITERTKIFCLCNPHNPVGRAWTREELLRLADICLRHNILIVSDDVYCGLLYPGSVYTPIASLSPEISRNTISLFSTSKTYNTTGLRFSYVVMENPEHMARYMGAIRKANLFYGQNMMGIEATIAAYNHCDAWVADLMTYVQGNFEILKQTLAEGLPTATIYKPDATYFAWVDLHGLGLSQAEITQLLEKQAHILVCPGDELGTGGDRFIRINMGCSHETMTALAHRLVTACAPFSNQ